LIVEKKEREKFCWIIFSTFFLTAVEMQNKLPSRKLNKKNSMVFETLEAAPCQLYPLFKG